MVEKLFPDPFPKRQNWAYYWINSLKFHTAWFYCMLSKRLSSCRPIVLTWYKDFLKKKKRPGFSLLASFSERFLNKNVLLVIFY